MASVHQFSDHVIDWAERLQDVADAAEGKGNRRGGIGARWLLLPAAGAGIYALATSNSFGRTAKGVIDQAKSRASELPDDLLGRVKQTSQKQKSTPAARRRNGSSSRSSSARRTSSQRKSASSR